MCSLMVVPSFYAAWDNWSKQCAKDCGPLKCTCVCAIECVNAWGKDHCIGPWWYSRQPKQVLKIVPVFLISTCEESSLQMKHAKKNCYLFFDFEVHDPWQTPYNNKYWCLMGWVLLPYDVSFAALCRVFCRLMLNFWSAVQKSVAFF